MLTGEIGGRGLNGIEDTGRTDLCARRREGRETLITGGGGRARVYRVHVDEVFKELVEWREGGGAMSSARWEPRAS
jgi:hypothetical protein